MFLSALQRVATYRVELAEELRSLFVATLFKLLFVFGNLGGSGVLASVELSLKLGNEVVESILELLLGFAVGSISSVKLSEKTAVVGRAGLAGSDDEISLHLSQVSNLNRAKVSAVKKINNMEKSASKTISSTKKTHVKIHSRIRRKFSDKNTLYKKRSNLVEIVEM